MNSLRRHGDYIIVIQNKFEMALIQRTRCVQTFQVLIWKPAYRPMPYESLNLAKLNTRKLGVFSWKSEVRHSPYYCYFDMLLTQWNKFVRI